MIVNTNVAIKANMLHIILFGSTAISMVFIGPVMYKCDIYKNVELVMKIRGVLVLSTILYRIMKSNIVIINPGINRKQYKM